MFNQLDFIYIDISFISFSSVTIFTTRTSVVIFCCCEKLLVVKNHPAVF